LLSSSSLHYEWHYKEKKNYDEKRTQKIEEMGGSLPSRSLLLQDLGLLLPSPESPPFFKLLKLWKIKAFKTKL